MKICLLIKSFDNPNGITRCARGLAESDRRFRVVEYKTKAFAEGPLSKISRYTFDEILDANALSKLDADVLLPMTPVESIPIFMRGDKPKGVVIFDMVHWLPWRDKSSYLFRVYSFIHRRYDFAAYKYSARVFCVSDFVKGQLIHQFGNRSNILVVTPGLTKSFVESAAEARKQSQVKPRKTLSLLMVPGALTPDEGIGGTIGALSLVKKKYSDHQITLTLVASRRLEFFAHLESYASSLGVELKLAISPSDSQLQALYSSSDVFVHAGNDDWFHYTPLEAMACGAPTVFCTDLASIGIFEGAVARAKFNDSVSISNAIIEAGLDAQKRSFLISQGTKVVSETSMSNAAARIYGAFSK